MLFLAVWWLWIFTSWFTNWLDPEKMPVRVLLFALMLGGLLLSSSIPEAFAGKGAVFGCVFAAMQVGRTLFMLWALRGESRAQFRNFLRILLWFLASAVFWIWGGFEDDPQRTTLWMLAIAVEYLSPSLAFRVPGLGRSSTTDWDIDGGHLSERCGLFVIIALGESILVTGATFAESSWNATTVAAFLTSFLGSIAMWWVYFDTSAERASHRIDGAAELLADEFAFHGPILQANGKADFVAGSATAAAMARGCEIHRQWVDGEAVCSIYDFKIETPVGTGSIPMAEWSVIRDGKLVSSRLIFDTATMAALMPAG